MDIMKVLDLDDLVAQCGCLIAHGRVISVLMNPCLEGGDGAALIDDGDSLPTVEAFYYNASAGEWQPLPLGDATTGRGWASRAPRPRRPSSDSGQSLPRSERPAPLFRRAQMPKVGEHEPPPEDADCDQGQGVLDHLSVLGTWLTRKLHPEACLQASPPLWEPASSLPVARAQLSSRPRRLLLELSAEAAGDDPMVDNEDLWDCGAASPEDVDCSAAGGGAPRLRSVQFRSQVSVKEVQEVKKAKYDMEPQDNIFWHLLPGRH
mmetsp:Transcript_67620/g.220116  ORF Transcript_67620/g.220116 Transcript_67620/m.220116 type:complete len:263 (-) Transcript_67620:458-1246(-)